MIKNIISDIGNVLFEFDTSGFIDKNIETEDKEKFFNFGSFLNTVQKKLGIY